MHSGYAAARRNCRRPTPIPTAPHPGIRPALKGPHISHDASDYRASSSEGLGDRRGEESTGLAIELAGCPANPQPLPIRRFGDDVEVDMEDGLMSPRAVVLEQVELGGSGRGKDGSGDPGQDPPHGRRGVVAELVEGRRGFLGDHQGVTGAEGEDVKEGKDVGILVDLVTGNLASDDFGEDGLSHAQA